MNHGEGYWPRSTVASVWQNDSTHVLPAATAARKFLRSLIFPTLKSGNMSRFKNSLRMVSGKRASMGWCGGKALSDMPAIYTLSKSMPPAKATDATKTPSPVTPARPVGFSRPRSSRVVKSDKVAPAGINLSILPTSSITLFICSSALCPSSTQLAGS